MAEIRCPMCSKPNPEEAEECGFCGARLKPLVADDQSTDAPQAEGTPSGQSGQEEGVPDWLNRIRARAEEETEPEEQPEEESETDWLSRLRSVETDEGGPPEDIPDWLEQDEASSAEGEDDWLNRLRDTTSEADSQSEEPLDTSDEPEATDFDAVPESQTDASADYDQQLRDLVPEVEDQEDLAEFEVPAEEMPSDELETSDWLEEDEADLEEDFPDWFGQGAEAVEEEEPLGFKPDASEETAIPPSADAERPDWFDEFEEAGESAAEEGLEQPPSSALEDDEIDALEAEGVPDWLDDDELEAEDRFETELIDEPEADFIEPEPEEEPAQQPTSALEGDEVEAFEDEALPDWMDEEEVEAADRFEPQPDQVESEEPAEVDWQEVDWEALAGEDEVGEAPMPEGLGAPPEEEEEDLPHVPALIFDEEGDGITGGSTDEFDLDAIELPDWLTEVDREPGVEGVETPESGDLAPATIPNWLEAMRPVETFKPVVDIEPEEEKSVESVGPLAGLRGVLLAEPVVAKPRTSTSVGERLQVTERQYAQAEILRRIIEREDQERIGARASTRGLPIFRWLIGLVLILAVLVPPILGFPSFETPDAASSDLRPLLDVVNSVESGQAALVVFDYEPGYSAELEAVGSAMLHNLMARNVNIVTVSTRPTGPPLALNLVEEVGEAFAVENGRDYIHLGYLSGGPTAVQLFSIAPQDAILKGFMLPDEMELESGWDAPILREVDRLSDFGLVAVVTAGTDNARIWAEQAHPWLDETPMVMVLSAGAEPMIRPYFESLDPQVDGILTGLPTAVYYEEQINNQPGQARARWDSFGAGVLAVEVILVIGLIYGVVDWIIDRRRESEQA